MRCHEDGQGGTSVGQGAEMSRLLYVSTQDDDLPLGAISSGLQDQHKRSPDRVWQSGLRGRGLHSGERLRRARAFGRRCDGLNGGGGV